MLTHISSADNPKVRLVRKLATRRGRDKESGFVVEGLNLVEELINGEHDIDFIMFSDGFTDSRSDMRKQDILAFIENGGCDACSVSDAVFSGLSDAEHGIEILAVVRSVSKGIDAISELPEGSNIIVCDRIQDPGNMGTMIRTAVAAGYGAMIALPGTVDVYSPKVLRATAGMVFRLPIIHAESEDELFRLADRTGRKVVVTVPERGTEYYNADLDSGIALVIGNEGQGVSQSIMDRADIRVTIPMKGNTESLNAATAAAILMYETIRRNR